MSNPQDSATTRDASEKTYEGMRLLRSGDYRGAIAASTEAIGLDPYGLSERNTLEEAYIGLAEAKKAEAWREDRTRTLDVMMSGPGTSLDEKVRRRFFGED